MKNNSASTLLLKYFCTFYYSQAKQQLTTTRPSIDIENFSMWTFRNEPLPLDTHLTVIVEWGTHTQQQWQPVRVTITDQVVLLSITADRSIEVTL